MAQNVTVLDIGTWSAKSVLVRVPVVGFSVGAVKEVVLPSALESKTRKGDQLKGAKELLPGKRLTGENVTVLMQADRAMNRDLKVPFSDRGKIDQILGFELENHIPFDSEEVVFDYMVQAKSKEGANLFVSVLPRKDMEEFQEAATQLNIDPRMVGHQAVASGRLYELLREKPRESVAFVDIGHRKTVVSVVKKGAFVGTRTIMFGGYDLTRALSERFSISMDEAQQEKHESNLFPAGHGTAVGRIQQAADCLLENLKSLVRDLNHTFQALGGVQEIYLFGGTALLRGLDVHFKRVLGLPVKLLLPSLLKIKCDEGVDEPQYVSAIAGGYSSQRGRANQRINFRQGPFLYEGDYKAVRGRIWYLAVMGLFLFTVLLFPQWMQYRAFEEQKELLGTQLKKISAEILGEEIDDWEDILDRLEEMPSSEAWTVFPDLTAHEIYWEIADIVARIDGTPSGESGTAIPPGQAGQPGESEGGRPGNKDGRSGTGLSGEAGQAGEDAGPDRAGGGVPGEEGESSAYQGPPDAQPVDYNHHLDMSQIRIDGASRTSAGEGVVEYTGNASSVATMDLFLARLGAHECFHNVQRTKQEVLKATVGKEGWWRFTVEFTVSCPKKASAATKKERAEEEGGKETAAKDSKGAKESKESKDKKAAKDAKSGKDKGGEDKGKSGTDKGGVSGSGKSKGKERDRDRPVTPKVDQAPAARPGAETGVRQSPLVNRNGLTEGEGGEEAGGGWGEPLVRSNQAGPTLDPATTRNPAAGRVLPGASSVVGGARSTPRVIPPNQPRLPTIPRQRYLNKGNNTDG